MALMAACVSLMQVVAFAFVWALNRNIPGLGSWAVCSAFSVGALVLMLLRQVVDAPLVTRVLPTLLAWAGAVFFLRGAAAIRGSRIDLTWPLLACLPCLAGYVWFGWGTREIWLRPLFYSAPMVLFLGLGARELLLERRGGLRFSARLVAYASLVYIFSFILRGLLIATQRTDPEPFLGGPAQILAFASTLFWLLAWAFGTLLLVNQWRNQEKLQIQEAQVKAAEELVRTARELAVTERELEAERAQRQRALLQRDLHDGLGGVTANLVLLASMGRGRETSSERQELMRHIEHLAIECNREVRLLMDVLQKGSMDWHRFLQEFREYAKHLAAGHRFALQWGVAGRLPAQPLADVAAQISLMRCLKEAVNNLARHADARQAVIAIRFFRRSLGVTVRDDGIGLRQPEGTGSDGHGLRNMRRRCQELNGRVSIRSAKGTTIRFVIPLPVRLDPVAKKPPFPELAAGVAGSDDGPR
jgi:signal transduction histidine kinase